MKIKFRIILIIFLAILGLFIAPTEVFAVVQSLNGQTGQTQTFQNDTNVTVSSSNNIHSLGWQGYLSLARGGTGATSFLAGSLLFSDGTKIAEDNSHLFWDNVNKRLGIGTSSPAFALDVSGNAKVTSLTSINDSSINGVKIGLGGGSVTTNTAIGENALSTNTSQTENTAVGYSTLGNKIDGGDNTAVGSRALSGFLNGSFDTALGSRALWQNTTGSFNTAVGMLALSSNTAGGNNTALGFEALTGNTIGSQNVAIGDSAFTNNLTGSGNIVIGNQAAKYQADSSGLTTPTSSIYIGFLARGFDNNDNNSIVLGASTTGAGANTAVIGNSSMTDVYLGSASGNANAHAKKIYLGSSFTPGCIIMGDSDGSGLTYITVNDGVISASTTAPGACQ